MSRITNTPQVPAGSNATPIGALTDWLRRSDFACNALAGIPLDYWTNKLGTDPRKWADEAIVIRIAYEKEMQALGVGINLSVSPQAVNLAAPEDSGPLGEFYKKLWDPEYMKAFGGVSPAVNRLRPPMNDPYAPLQTASAKP